MRSVFFVNITARTVATLLSAPLHENMNVRRAVHGITRDRKCTGLIMKGILFTAKLSPLLLAYEQLLRLIFVIQESAGSRCAMGTGETHSRGAARFNTVAVSNDVSYQKRGGRSTERPFDLF